MTDTASSDRRLTIRYVDLDKIRSAERNPKLHDLPTIRSSLARFGIADVAGIVNEATGRLVAGHGRITALRDMRDTGDPAPAGVTVDAKGRWKVPVLSGVEFADEAEAEAFLLAHNRTTELGGWDYEALDLMISDLDSTGIGFDLAGGNDFATDDTEDNAPAAPASLADRFVVPPFSVLDSRQGYWRDRKDAWLSLGIRSEEGRSHNSFETGRSPNASTPNSPHAVDPNYYNKKNAAEARLRRRLTDEEFIRDHWDGTVISRTSIFDPVLAEIAYRWFSPEGGTVLDPFAGGSVRGVVAGWLGRRYHGVDLSEDQIAANRRQADAIAAVYGPDDFTPPTWTVGDSAETIPSLNFATPVDMVLSCPPYYDLEVYSDDPADLSAAGTYDDFLETYRQIIAASCAHLAEDRFAAWVVGDIRDKHGNLRNLIGDTVDAFTDAGLTYHNDAILLTPLGSVQVRAARIFNGARRLARIHQYLLIFAKGDPSAAAEAYGQVDATIDSPDIADVHYDTETPEMNR